MMTTREALINISIILGTMGLLRPAVRNMAPALETSEPVLAYDVLSENSNRGTMGPIDKSLGLAGLGIGGATAASLFFCRQNRRKEEELPESVK